MTTNDTSMKKSTQRYEYLPPEGGWGYVVTLATSVMFIVTVVPLAAFGMVFGKFLASIGDETSGTTLANGIFNTVLSFTGLAANHLLQKMSCRKVGLIGAGLFFIGCFATAFVTSLTQMIISFGVIQGLGFGLMMPAVFTSFNSYFDKRKNVMMGIAQAIIVAVTIGWPALTEMLMENYGFRGTVAIFAALSLNCFVAMVSLQPVKWHMKKVPLPSIQVDNELLENNKETVDGTKIIPEEKRLLDGKQLSNPIPQEFSRNNNKQRPSVISIGSMAISVGSSINKIGKHENVKSEEKISLWSKISKSLDLVLFKDPVYVNITFGLSLSLTADLAFISILPLLLTNLGFSATEITLVMTVYFICDLASRIFLSVLSAVINVRNRYVFLIGTMLSALFRIAFVMNNSMTWILVVSGSLGFLRCFIQTPLPLVIAEQYPNRFATAFSLYMVVCGVVSLIMGPLIGFVKAITQSDKMVVHVLTCAYLLCGIPWIIEMTLKRLRRKSGSEDK